MKKLPPRDEQNLHDWITNGIDLDSEGDEIKTGNLDSDFETEFLKYKLIRKALRSLPMLEPPRSFRLTPDMVGVKPPRPRFSIWMNAATAFFSLVFVFSLGLRINGIPYSPFTNFDAAMMSSEESLESAEPLVAMAPARAAEPVDLPPTPEPLTSGSAPAEGAAESELEIMEEPPADVAMKAAPQAETMTMDQPIPDEPEILDPGIQPLDWLVWISLLFVFLLLAFTKKMREHYEDAWRAKWNNDRK